ncbi:MAG TPA: ABC transporter permease [Ktedonobacterales bacterium]|nr:ABC transporter permease [Ktedonobacterales bacterium]
MSDMFTIVWKEWKDSLFQGGWRAWIRPVLLIGILGVFEPLVGKLAWMELSPIELVVFLWFAFFVIISIVADSFAGERERHTLETLLASRMPDRSILFGKVLTVVLYGWGVMVIGLFLGALVDNLAHGQGQFVFYPVDMLLFTLLLSLLVGILGASAGILLSLRMSTVRQVQQMLTIGTLIVGFAVIGLLQLLPQSFFVSFTPDEILWMAAGLVAVLDIVLLAFTLARFQRAKLILS